MNTTTPSLASFGTRRAICDLSRVSDMSTGVAMIGPLVSLRCIMF
nr:D529 [uncultured bacterium]